MTAPSLEALDDYLSQQSDDAEAERLEEALFDSAAHGGAEGLAWLEKLRCSLVDLARRGSYDVTLTVAELEELKRTTTLQLRVFDAVADAGLDAQALLAGLDLVAFEFPVKLGDAAHVDLELGFGEQTVLRLPDVKVDRENERVILCCEGELARASFRAGSFTRVVAVEGARRRTLAEFRYTGPAPRV